LNRAMRIFRARIDSSHWADKIPQVDLATGDDEMVRAVIHFLGRDHGALADWMRPLHEEFGFSLYLQTGRKETLRPLAGEEDLHLHVGDPVLDLAYGPGGFAQVNLEQNRKLVDAVLQAAELTGKERVLDLFCGMGNFSLPLARQAGEVTGVEEHPKSIEKARQNARRNGIVNAAFHARPAEGAAEALSGGRLFDLVVLDPPRTADPWRLLTCLVSPLRPFSPDISHRKPDSPRKNRLGSSPNQGREITDFFPCNSIDFMVINPCLTFVHSESGPFAHFFYLGLGDRTMVLSAASR
ncbi:MAG: methyltransferase domain-containing protein, partial [Desulfuromonadales bacterium]